MYGLIKTIANYVGLLALVFTVVLLLIQKKVSGGVNARVTLTWTVFVACLSLVAYVASVLIFGPLQARQERLGVYREQIRSAIAQVTLLIECEESFVGTHIVGIRCGFGQGATPILATLTNQFLALPKTNQLIALPPDMKRSILTFSAELDKSVGALPFSVGTFAGSDNFVIAIGSDKIPEGARTSLRGRSCSR